MLRFIAGILVVQLATIALLLVADLESGKPSSWLPVAIALATIALVAAFWFTALATTLHRRELDRLRADFAREREDLRVKAEREKTRLVRDSHKSVSVQTRRAEARANRRVAMAVTAAAAVGLGIVMISSMVLGGLLLAGTGGALGGYLAGRRWPLPGRSSRLPDTVKLSPGRWLRLPDSNRPKK